MDFKTNKFVRIVLLLKDKTGRREFVLKLKLVLWPLLRFLALAYRRTILRQVKIVAVIGSLGKTTTVKAINCILGIEQEEIICSNRFGTIAWSLLTTSPFCKVKVFEIGIDQPGTMDKIGKVFNPDYIVFTSVGLDHAPDFNGIEHIRDEKSRMVKYLKQGGVLLINGDDKNVLDGVEKYDKPTLKFGFSKVNYFQCVSYSLNLPFGMNCDLNVQGELIQIQSKLIGEKLIYALLAAFASGIVLKIDKTALVKRLAKLQPAYGRMNTVLLPAGALVIGDFYKATIDSVLPALEIIKSSKAERKILFFGDLGYLRGNFQKIAFEYGKKMGTIFTHAIFVGEMEAAFLEGAICSGLDKRNIVLTNNSWKRGIEAIPNDLSGNDIIYVSGRVHQKMERVFLALQGEDVSCNLKLCNRYSYCKSCVDRNSLL